MPSIIVNNSIYSSDTPCISAFDRGFTLGHGFFETIFYNGQSCPLLAFHWSRLVTSAQLLGVKLAFDLSELQRMVNDLVDLNQLTKHRAIIRLTITDGVATRGLLSNGEQKSTFVLTVSPWMESKQKLSAIVVKTRRNENSITSRVKSISYLDNILAKQEAVAHGFDEAFLLNSRDGLAEGALSNVFVVKDGLIYTPRLEDGALPGVVRHVILKELSVEIKEQAISEGFLAAADEVFITNALLGVKSIFKLNQQYLPASCPITENVAKSLQTAFNYL